MLSGNDTAERTKEFYAEYFAVLDIAAEFYLDTARAVFQEHHLAEQRVQERTQELRAANAELEAFSYSLSHDLRAPLRAIAGFSQVVLSRYADKLDADGRFALERIRAGSERMGVLIDSMLELSRLGRRPLEFRDLELSALAGEVVEELRAAEPERDVEVLIEPNVSAVGDEELLRAALQNLLGNAFKFTSPKPHARCNSAAPSTRARPRSSCATTASVST